MVLPDVSLRAEVYKADISIPVTLFLNFPRTNYDVVKCGFLADSPPNSLVIKDNTYYYQVRAKNRFGNNIWIPRLRPDFQPTYREYSENDKATHGFAELYVEGDLDSFAFGNKIKGYVFLQDNPFFRAHDDTNPVQWDTPFGSAMFIYDYRYGGHIRDMSEVKHLKQHFIELTIDASERKSAYDLLNDIETYLDEVMHLFWFLSKKYLFWYKLEMYDADLKPITIYKDARVVLRNKFETQSPVFQNHPMDLLINIQEFPSLARNVFHAFTQSEHKAVIKKIIDFMMMTHTEGFVETYLSFIYTALEIIVDKFTAGYIIGGSRFSKLVKSLQEFLDNQIVVQLNDNEREEIKNKFPELRRFQVRTRLNELFISKLDAIALQLPSSITCDVLIERLHKAVSRRNDYIHQGFVEDIGIAMADVALIRFFISLWILSQINYPLEKISGHDDDLGLVDWAIKEFG